MSSALIAFPCCPRCLLPPLSAAPGVQLSAARGLVVAIPCISSPNLVVVPSHKLLWCPSYGTASDAVYQALLRALGATQLSTRDCYTQECPGAPLRVLNTSFQYREAICDSAGDWFSFAFVKNPFDHVYEVFAEWIAPTPCRSARVCRHHRAIRALAGLSDKAPIEFKDFVRYIKSQKPREMDPWWMPMSWSCRVSGPWHFPYSFVGRIEREPLAGTVRRIFHGVGIDPAAFHEDDIPPAVLAQNHSMHEQAVGVRMQRRERYRCTTCSNLFELRNIVAKVYHNDLARFYFTNFRRR